MTLAWLNLALALLNVLWLGWATSRLKDLGAEVEDLRRQWAVHRDAVAQVLREFRDRAEGRR
jgi:hypothetical protein